MQYVGLNLNTTLCEFNPLAPVVSVPLFHFTLGGYDIAVSNHILMMTVATVFLLVFMPFASRHPRLVPRGINNLIESMCVFIREEVARPMLGSHTDQYISFIWTIFFFILTLNLFALFPSEKIIHLVTGKENYFGGAATANIYVTGALAVITFLLTHASGIKHQGLKHYFANFAPHVGFLTPMIYFLELISAFVRPFALAVRLFANMVSGHTLLATMLGLIFIFKNWGVAGASVVMVVLLSVMELFVAFLQAYIFTFLSALYIGSAIAPEH